MGIIIKNSAKVTVINIVGVAIAAFSVLFVQTYYLNEDEIGALKILNSLALIIFPFIMMGFGSTAMKFHHHFSKNKEQNSKFLTYIIFLPLVLLFLFTVISFFLQEWIETSLFKESSYLRNFVLLIPAMIFYYGYSLLFESLSAIKNRIIIPSILKSIISRLYMIVLVILYGTNNISFNSLLITYVSLHILNTFILIFYYLKSNAIKFEFNLGFQKEKQYRAFTIYSLFTILANLSSVIVSQIDTVMTASMLEDIGRVGVYSIAFFMGVVIEIPKRPVIQMTIPLISENLEKNNLSYISELYKKSSINLLIIGSVIFIATWTNIDSIFQIIPNGEKFIDGKYVVFFIALSKLFDLAVGINHEIIQYSKYYKWNIFLTPFLAIIAILTNIFFIKAYGIVGTAIATAISIFAYNTIRSILVYYFFKMTAINYKHLIIVLLLLLSVLSTHFITIENPYLSIVITSFIALAIFITPVVYFKLSEELNLLIKKAMTKIQAISKK